MLCCGQADAECKSCAAKVIAAVGWVRRRAMLMALMFVRAVPVGPGARVPELCTARLRGANSRNVHRNVY
eukprot:5174532-Prymnesium_polylepis.1